jgi:hypothetical protein
VSEVRGCRHMPSQPGTDACHACCGITATTDIGVGKPAHLAVSATDRVLAGLGDSYVPALGGCARPVLTGALTSMDRTT